jgi:hypothetical protein
MSHSVAHVFKRGKARQDARPVAITLDTLQQFSQHPLPAAAEALGVSVTALKGACRKLGIQRWPYWAGRGTPANAFDPARETHRSAHNGQLLPLGLWDTAHAQVPDPRGPRGIVGARHVCDAGTQTELTFNGLDFCQAPTLVDTDVFLHDDSDEAYLCLCDDAVHALWH